MTASNLYATKLYAEHPVGLWPIDDDLSYLSLIGGTNRVLTNWSSLSTVAPYSGFYADGIQDPIFKDDTTYRVSGAYSTVTEGDKTYYAFGIESPALFNFFSDLNHEQKVFSINTYIYHSVPAAFYELGYKYNDGTKDVLFTERISAGRAKEWIRVGKTFDPDLRVNKAAFVYIKVYFSVADGASFLINGTSIGQWSETQSHMSLGVHPTKIGRSTGIPACLDKDVFGIELHEYGNGQDTAYATVQDNRLLAINDGIPLVYGSASVTTLIPSNNIGTKVPSLIVPGKGFLNGAGRYANHTLEAWVRIDSTASNSRRIIGPLASLDGIYVLDNSIALVIGDTVKSYSVGEWYRPMLLHVTLKDSEAALLINGDKVISMPYKQSSAVLPTNTSYNQDWIGFYSWEDIRVFEIDSIAVFPYIVPPEVAKRRFVWGQGVDSPELIDSPHLGTAHSIDFAYAGYRANQSYPESARWDSGAYDNLSVTRYGIKAPAYVLPDVVSGRRPVKKIMEQSKKQWTIDGGKTFIRFNDSTITDPAYIYFRSTDVIAGAERVFYVVCDGDSYGPVFVFLNNATGKRLRADISSGTLVYSFDGVPFGTKAVAGECAVGLDFTTVPADVSDFLKNTSQIELLVGGDGAETFGGNIYRVGFCSRENSAGIEADFTDGIIDHNADLGDFIASYTLAPVAQFGKYYLDIMAAGTWTESYPLGYFDADNKLDFLQFNIGVSDSTVVAHGRISKVSSKAVLFSSDIIEPNAAGIIDLTKSTDYLSKTLLLKNNTVIVPPKGIDIDELVLTLKLTVNVHGISTESFYLRNMSLASVAGTGTEFMKIGTSHGNVLSPYTKVGNYYTNRVDKPWTIYKQTTPYLYLTNDSGIHPLTSIQVNSESGLWINMNKNRANDFKISAMQIWVKYAEPDVPTEPTELFSVRSKDRWIKFMGVDDGTGLRVRIYSIDGYTGMDYTGVRFYQDGDDVIMPFIQNNHWTALGFDFEPLLDLSLGFGSICLISGCLFNNIVFYQTSSLQEQYIYAYRTWSAVKNDGTTDLAWEYWKGDPVSKTWDEVSKAMTISYGASIGEIYKTYIGTNRFVVDSNNTLQFGNSKSTVISSEISTVSDGSLTKISITNDPNWLVLTKKPY